jgi:hypothetical protein
MGAEASVVACSNCSALYTAGPGDRGFCADCRRRIPATPPPKAPIAAIRTTAPVRMAAPMAAPRMTPTDTRRPNFRPPHSRSLRPTSVIIAVLILGAAGLAVWQRQWLSKEWTKLQRHGVSGEWASIQHKASDLWVDVRNRLPRFSSDNESSGTTTSRSHAANAANHEATATRGTHRQPQVAERSTKRKGASKQKQDLNTPGSSP